MKKTAIITGASRGIGREIAKRLDSDGFCTALIYQSREAEALSLRESMTNESRIYRCDVSSSDEVNKTVSRILDDFGDVYLLVNNAGIAQQKLFSEITDADWEKMICVNLSGAFYMSRAVVPQMVNKKQGRIINITSMWGQTGASCEVHYSAAKAGIIGMTKALAKELAPSGITVNAVAPGIILTDMMSGFSEEEKEEMRKDVPLERLGSAEDIAKAVSFLAGDSSSYITGQVLGVNGGLVI